MPVFEQSFLVRAPLGEVAAFHDEAASLAAITPPPIKVKVIRFDAPVRAGSRVIFRLMLGPFTVATWDGEIVAYEPGASFRDVLHRGPFERWSHTHTFAAKAGGTQVTDRVEYEPPFGFIGKIVDFVFIRPSLRFMFWYRARRTRRRLERRAALWPQSS